MLLNETLKQIMIEKGFSYATFAEVLNVDGKDKVVKGAKIYGRLKSENIGFKTAIEMLNIFGYEMIVRPKGGLLLPNERLIDTTSEKVDYSKKAKDMEDIVCEHCGRKIKGKDRMRFTKGCPFCLTPYNQTLTETTRKDILEDLLK